MLDEEFKKKFRNTFEFSKNNINKFIVVKEWNLSIRRYG